MIISVVATYHTTRGLVTPEALLSLLESMSPEVLFLEVPEARFSDFQEGAIGTLEAAAVQRYCETHDPMLVPVDAPPAPSSFWRGTTELFRRLERGSADFRRRHDTHMSALARGGFSYLNSEQGSDGQAAVDAEMVATLRHMKNQDLSLLHEAWCAMNHSREDAMLSHIVAYARKSRMTKAVFLVGGAHRRSIMRKTHSGLPGASPDLRWEFARLESPDSAG